MARKASAAKVQEDMREPNYKAAISLLRKDVPEKKTVIGTKNKEIGELYGRVEGYGVPKKVAAIFMSLDKLEAKERLAFFRHLNFMADAADWEKSAQDLVDIAEDNEVEQRFPEDEQAVHETKAAQKRKTAAIANIADARRHLNNEPPIEPYTGDNSDLAGE